MGKQSLFCKNLSLFNTNCPFNWRRQWFATIQRHWQHWLNKETGHRQKHTHNTKKILNEQNGPAKNPMVNPRFSRRVSSSCLLQSLTDPINRFQHRHFLQLLQNRNCTAVGICCSVFVDIGRITNHICFNLLRPYRYSNILIHLSCYIVRCH
jgi:hypothetical protein